MLSQTQYKCMVCSGTVSSLDEHFDEPHPCAIEAARILQEQLMHQRGFRAGIQSLLETEEPMSIRPSFERFEDYVRDYGHELDEDMLLKSIRQRFNLHRYENHGTMLPFSSGTRSKKRGWDNGNIEMNISKGGRRRWRSPLNPLLSKKDPSIHWNPKRRQAKRSAEKNRGVLNDFEQVR